MKITYGGLVGALLVLIVAGFPIASVVASLAEVDSRYVTVPYRAAIFLVSSILIVWSARRTQAQHSIAVLSALLLFWLLYLLRLATETALQPAYLTRPIWEYWVYAIGTGLIPALSAVLGARALPLEQTRKILMVALTIAVVAVAVIAPEISDTAGRRLRPNPVLNPISAAQYASSLFLLSLWSVALLRPRRRGTIALLLLSGILLLYIQAMTASRGPLVIVISATGLILIASLKRRRFIGLSVLLVALTAVLWSFAQFLDIGARGALAWQRLSGTVERVQAGEELRVELWRSAAELFLENPILGAALEDPSYPGYPHNLLIEGFMTTGIIGGVVLLLLVSFCIWRAIVLIMKRDSRGWVGLLALQMIFWSMFSGAVYSRPETWLFIGLMLGVRRYSTYASDSGA